MAEIREQAVRLRDAHVMEDIEEVTLGSYPFKLISFKRRFL